MRLLVVGAGTAGWLTAASIKRNCPHIDVTLLHDPSIKSIGVGETLVWSMPRYFHDILGLKNRREWMKRSNATFKIGMSFQNMGTLGAVVDSAYAPDLSSKWLYSSQDPKTIFDYQYGHESVEGSLLEIWINLHNGGKYGDLLQSPFPGLADGHYFGEYKTSIIDKEGNWLLSSELNGYSYNYDASEVGNVIGELVGRPFGVKEVHGNVQSVVTEGDNIKELLLSDGRTITSDIYVDCTGFKKQLIKHLPFKWHSCDEYVNNSALVKPIFYDGSDNRARLPSNRSAMYGQKNGWSFEVPLAHRTGNGYVFNSRITPDVNQIADEYNEFLGPENKEGDLRLLQWDPGYYKQIMVGNCMTFGLAWGFIDPYSANNLAHTIQMLQLMIQSGDMDRLSKNPNFISDFRNKYNHRGFQLWDNVEHRLESVFRMTNREDTEYWKIMKDVGERNNTREWVNEYVRERDRMTKFGNKSMLHTYILVAQRMGIKLDNAPITISEETEKRFIDYFMKKKTENEIKARNSMPLKDFYKFFYSDEFPNQHI